MGHDHQMCNNVLLLAWHRKQVSATKGKIRCGWSFSDLWRVVLRISHLFTLQYIFKFTIVSNFYSPSLLPFIKYPSTFDPDVIHHWFPRSISWYSSNPPPSSFAFFLWKELNTPHYNRAFLFRNHMQSNVFTCVSDCIFEKLCYLWA